MKKLSIVGILSLLAFGCGDDDDRDTRPMLMDSGTIMLPDSSTTDPVDSGMMTTEQCRQPLPPLPAAALPRCSAETATCLMGAMSEAAVGACFDADTTPPFVEGTLEIDCGFCSTLQLISCGSNNGCGTEWGNWSCCIEACADQACAQACTATHRGPFVACLQGLGATCQGADASCFP